MRRIAVSPVAFAIIGLLGCAHSPVARFYTLDMTASGALHPQYNLRVDRLRAAEPLARADILVKKTPTEIEYYASDRWAAGVAELVTEKLEAEFGPRAENRKTILLSGTILCLEQADRSDGVAEAHIKLELTFRWETMGRHEAPLLCKVYELNIPAEAATPKAVVRALSKGVDQLAAQIVADANALR